MGVKVENHSLMLLIIILSIGISIYGQEVYASEREQQILALLHKISGSTARYTYEVTGKVDLHRLVQKEAKKQNIPAAFIAAVITIESEGNPCATSNVGAMGLMQLMPKTAKYDLRISDAYNPRQNVKGGSQYLAEGMQQTQNNTRLTTARYHAGPKALKMEFNTLPKSTQHYVRSVDKKYQQYKTSGWKKNLPKYIKQTNKHLCRKLRG